MRKDGGSNREKNLMMRIFKRNNGWALADESPRARQNNRVISCNSDKIGVINDPLGQRHRTLIVNNNYLNKTNILTDGRTNMDRYNHINITLGCDPRPNKWINTRFTMRKLLKKATRNITQS